jgi:hypothetical protein
MSVFKRRLAAMTFLITSPLVIADTWINGYVRRDGTYVEGHYRQERNSTNLDNYSTQGNVNPYSGEQGTRARAYSLQLRSSELRRWPSHLYRSTGRAVLLQRFWEKSVCN